MMFADQPTGRTRIFSAAAAHVAAVLLLLLVASLIPEKTYETVLPDRLPKEIVWIAQPGPGGGGGGSPKPEPPKLEAVKEPVKVPAVKAPETPPAPVPEIPVIEPPAIIPIDTLASTLDSSVGAIAPPSVSPGGGGAGTGAGQGSGRGIGPGSGGGTGGDVYQPGNGVLSPVPLQRVRPAYTSDAMRARQQGIVGLDCVVLPSGNVGDCDVVQSMRPPFGLDQEAVKAARQWRFRPGTRFGEPVSVLVRIELEFNLR